MSIAKDQTELIQWYQQNKRQLPWRIDRNPYRIWISEVMLQQTTVVAVIPFYEKFMRRFPNVADLANASEAEVLEMWAGLGYYSRARNLHKSAKILSAQGFPQKAELLIELPGFGPYTSRAVASLAFNEQVGVLDGNVIRVLSRFYGLKLKWWEGSQKELLQKKADLLAKTNQNSEINQGLMELGATICTPKKTLCLLCPWKKRCVAFKEGIVEKLPLSKPKKEFQIWQWTLNPIIKNNQIHLTENKTTPFLKNLLFPDGDAVILEKKPKNFDLKHSVTKFQIYIQISKNKKISKNGKWIDLDQIKKHNPTSLMSKILKHIEKKDL